MKMKYTAVMVACSLVLPAWISYGQGSLTPPGAPAATMKTLDQVEARTPIAEAEYTIRDSGSYYLTTNLLSSGIDNGIEVRASDVVIDLNGFTIDGSGATRSGIHLFSVANVIIANGTIRDCDRNGIYAYGSSNCVFRNLRLIGNARSDVAYAGLIGGEQCHTRDCVVLNNSGYGVKAYAGSQVLDNTIESNANAGLAVYGADSLVSGNIIRNNADNYEIVLGNQLNLLLCEIPETLDWPCSVKLTGTLTCTSNGVDGITVNANNVTIDMNGHALVGPGASSGHGIYQDTDGRDLTVHSGKVVNWSGSAKGGIYARGASVHISRVQASTNDYGIYTGTGSTVSDCSAYSNSDDGIRTGNGSTISDCSAYGNDGYGIYAGYGNSIRGCAAYHNDSSGIHTGFGTTITECAAYLNGYSGISAGADCTVRNCTGYNNDVDGISANSGSMVSGCTANDNGSDGIQVPFRAQVIGNHCANNGTDGDGAGIRVTGERGRICDNCCIENDWGIDVDDSGNFIARNTCSNNSTNWSIMANNTVGTIVTPPYSSAVEGNTGGSGVGSTDPWANFSYP